MQASAERVAARFLTADSEGAGLKKFIQLSGVINSSIATLPRLFQTFKNQAYGYKTQNLAKADKTREKIGVKLALIRQKAFEAQGLVMAFKESYEPTTAFKRRFFSEDLAKWMQKYDHALERIVQTMKEGFGHSEFSYGLGGTEFVHEGHNPLIDLQSALVNIGGFWSVLVKPDSDDSE